MELCVNMLRVTAKVITIIDDNFYSIDSSAIANLLDVTEAPQNNAMNETMAINAIQKSLMLCETAVNPTSSTITIPSTPPAYSTAVSRYPFSAYIFLLYRARNNRLYTFTIDRSDNFNFKSSVLVAECCVTTSYIVIINYLHMI